MGNVVMIEGVVADLLLLFSEVDGLVARSLAFAAEQEEEKEDEEEEEEEEAESCQQHQQAYVNRLGEPEGQHPVVVGHAVHENKSLNASNCLRSNKLLNLSSESMKPWYVISKKKMTRK